MAPICFLRSIPSAWTALTAAALLASCSSARIDPLEFQYYGEAGDRDTAIAGSGSGSNLPKTTYSYSDDLSSGSTDATDTTDTTGVDAGFDGAPLTTPPPVISEPIVPVSTPQVITVQKGDSLYALSRRHLGKGSRWREIASLNGLTDRQIRALPIGKQLQIPAR